MKDCLIFIIRITFNNFILFCLGKSKKKIAYAIFIFIEFDIKRISIITL